LDERGKAGEEGRSGLESAAQVEDMGRNNAPISPPFVPLSSSSLPVLLCGVNALLALLPDVLERKFLPRILETTQKLREGGRRKEGREERKGGGRVSPNFI